MNSAEDLVIDQVGWHTRVIDNPEVPERVKERFRAFVGFLQDNGLTRRVLLRPGDEIGDDFAIRRADLTDEGFELVKAGYDKWLRALDRGGTTKPLQLRPLERALAKLRTAGGRVH